VISGGKRAVVVSQDRRLRGNCRSSDDNAGKMKFKIVIERVQLKWAVFVMHGGTRVTRVQDRKSPEAVWYCKDAGGVQECGPGIVIAKYARKNKHVKQAIKPRARQHTFCGLNFFFAHSLASLAFIAALLINLAHFARLVCLASHTSSLPLGRRQIKKRTHACKDDMI
jgi:hypothetical protein